MLERRLELLPKRNCRRTILNCFIVCFKRRIEKKLSYDQWIDLLIPYTAKVKEELNVEAHQSFLRWQILKSCRNAWQWKHCIKDKY